MARVSDFTAKSQIRNSVHQEVEATYTCFEHDGEKYFQIDTYGTKGRKIPGKRSQSFQIDRDTAEALIALLKQEFSI